jgi:signal transduction histidine kinase
MRRSGLKVRWLWSALRRWREDRRAIFEFNRSITLIADPDALMASIAARIKELFGTERIIILRTFDDYGMFTVAYSTGWNADELKNIRLAQRDRLAKWLCTNETPLVVKKGTSVFDYLSPDEREMLTRLDVSVCVPLLALNRLTGMMLLSSSEKEWDLSPDDLNLLQMLMSQASIAFENAYLYQQQRDRLRRLYRAERLAAAGQLAATVAHEIRNPLTSIRSTVQYLLGEFDEKNPKRELIEGVIAEVDRIDRTVDGLLSLTRITDFDPERIALGQLIQQTILLVRTQGNSQSVEIDWSPPESEFYILGDEAQLKQLFLNIMLNALQAMSGGGRLTIKLSLKTEPLNEKMWAEALVADTGCGIPAEKLDKIFDPFFTTKKGGTGLGLPTSYAIARQHGGELKVKSREGEGTTIALVFPVVH